MKKRDLEKRIKKLENENCRLEKQQQGYYNQKNSLMKYTEDAVLDATDQAEVFIQQKNDESMQNNRAFANWIARIEGLEKDMDEQEERIIDLEATVKNQEKTIKKLKGKLNEKIETTDKEVKTIVDVIRDMGIAGGMFHSYIKKKDLPKEAQKCANKRIRQNKKYEYLGMSANNAQWKGGK